jgi:hypothetical protein
MHSIPSIRRIDEIMNTVETDEGTDYVSEHDDHGTVWQGDPDLSDEDNGTNAAYDILRPDGACHASSSHYHAAMWYSTDEDIYWHTGERRTSSYFLDGSDEFRLAVAKEFVRLGLGRIVLPSNI